MGILTFFFIALLIGLAIWLINTYTPIPAPIKKIILIAGIVVIILILLRATGILGHDVAIPTIR